MWYLIVSIPDLCNLITSTDGVITTKPHIYKEKTSNNYRPGPKVTGLQFANREKAVSKNNEHPGSTSSASLHSTLLARPAMNKSPLVMEVDSQISPISPPNRLNHLNLLNVSYLNNSVIPEQQEFENTTIVDWRTTILLLAELRLVTMRKLSPPNINIRECVLIM